MWRSLSELQYFFSYLRNPRSLLSVSGLIVLLALAGFLGYWLRSWLVAVAIGLGVLLLALLGLLLYLFVRQRRAQREEEGTGEEEDEDLRRRRAEEAERASLASLGERFERALEELRRSRLGRGGLYDLPWLLAIGEVEAGKSAAICESGLDLPSEYARLVSDGPTRDCDWWLANEAVVLDASGRFLEADEGPARSGWRKLLRLIRRARNRLPIEGVIVAVPVTKLLRWSPRELEEDARKLRRRLNELKDGLKVDAPVYVLVTKLDQLDGFVEFVSHIPATRLGEAFGWTNPERRFADAGDVTRAGLEEVRQRIDHFVPEMLGHEPGSHQRRKILLFAQDFDELIRALEVFVRRAFAPSVYDETPFLRGVYLSSARREGTTASAVLERLGHDWATGPVRQAQPGGYFLRDLFREIVVGDADLALPTRGLGPLGRRIVFGTAGLVVLGAVVLWSVSFWGNRAQIQRLEHDATSTLAAPASLPVLDRLRTTVEAGEERHARRMARVGLGDPLETALDRARRTYTWSFGREFEEASKANLRGAVRRYDDNSFEALAELALDIAWLSCAAECGEEFRPRLAKFAPITLSQADRESFRAGYDAFVRWARPVLRESRVEREREILNASAGQLLEMERLIRWSELNADTHPPARYADVGLHVPDDAYEGGVTGAFTRRTWESLVRGLISSVEATGGASRARLTRFRQDYVHRYDLSWRQYLLDTPLALQPTPHVKESPYVELVGQVHFNTDVDLPRDTKPPSWIRTLREVRREEPLQKEPESEEATAAAPDIPPWREYESILDQVGADAQAAGIRDEAALDVARKVAGDAPTSFRQGLHRVRRLVPSEGDPQAEEKLREILSMPILNGLSGVLDRALEAVDRRWVDRIARRFGRVQLTHAELEALYAPDTGELARFEKEVLGPFYTDGRPAAVLADREMRFGRDFVDWMQRADRVRRALSPRGGGLDEITVRLDGVPSRVLGGNHLITRRDLSMTCGTEVVNFSYREGTGSRAFAWTPACEEVVLRLWVRGPRGQERELLPRKQWRGPLAFPRFFAEAEPVGGNRFQWILRYPEDDLEVAVEYRLRSGRDILAIQHDPPPPTVREEG